MTSGTKSVLYGAHAFWLHPWFVAWAWWKLYGFPWDPRLWVAFFVHDLGYIGKPNMDGEEGEQHPHLGATIMGALFDVRGWRGDVDFIARLMNAICGDAFARVRFTGRPCSWYQFVFYHSRYLAKRYGVQPSRLCVADKLALALTPWWLYLPMVRATGEIREYMAHAQYRATGNEALTDDERRRVLSGNQRAWFAGVQDYCARWAWAHKDGAQDTWTSDSRNRATVDDKGVWK